MTRHRSAFTLIELLVVITIVAVLAGIALPVFGSMQIQGRKVQSVNNMRQLGTALTLYTGQNDGALPTEGESNPTWASAAKDPADNPANANAWYQALPKLGNFPAVGDFATARADFYTKKNLLYVPAATYPSTKVSGPGPLFAVSFCSKIFANGITTALVQNISQPSHLVIFQESGIPGEANTFSVKSAFNGQSKSFASRSIGRYNGKSILVFADGHVDLLGANDIVDPGTHQAYFPQSKGKVLWTMNPDIDANL